MANLFYTIYFFIFVKHAIIEFRRCVILTEIKEEKEYALQETRNDITDSDALSCERKDDFTLGWNTDVEAEGLIMQAHTTTSTCDGPQGDFKSNSSFSVDDQDMADAAKYVINAYS